MKAMPAAPARPQWCRPTGYALAMHVALPVRVHPLATPGPAVELEMGARAAEYDGGNAELGMRGSTVGLVDATLDQSER